MSELQDTNPLIHPFLGTLLRLFKPKIVCDGIAHYTLLSSQTELLDALVSITWSLVLYMMGNVHLTNVSTSRATQ